MKVLIGPNGDMDLENSIPELSDQFPDVEFLVSTSYVEAAQQVVDVDIIVGWINQAILEAAKNLKCIQSISFGANYYLNIPGLVDSDILLTSASGTHGACLAESAMGMIFAFTRGIRKCIQSQNTRQLERTPIYSRQYERINWKHNGNSRFRCFGSCIGQTSLRFRYADRSCRYVAY